MMLPIVFFPMFLKRWKTTYCWWFRNLANQLRSVVSPTLCKVLAPSQVVVWDFWTINSTTGDRDSLGQIGHWSHHFQLLQTLQAIRDLVVEKFRQQWAKGLDYSKDILLEFLWNTFIRSKYIYIYVYKYTCKFGYQNIYIQWPIRVYCLSRSPNSFTDDALNLSKENNYCPNCHDVYFCALSIWKLIYIGII